MKKEVANYTSSCLACQKAKFEHRRLVGELQSLYVPTWKWDSTSMDFVVGLPTIIGKIDAIGVIVDRLTKSAHFIAIRGIGELRD